MVRDIYFQAVSKDFKRIWSEKKNFVGLFIHTEDGFSDTCSCSSKCQNVLKVFNLFC